MAKYGAKYVKWAKQASAPANALPTYDAAISLSKLVRLSETPLFSEGSLYGDNELAEYAAEFVEADLEVEVTDITADTAAKVFGATIGDGGDITYSTEDGQPYGGLAFVSCKVNAGTKSFIGIFYPVVKGVLNGDNFETKGDSITFSTGSIKFKATGANNSAWKITSGELTTEALAKAWVDGCFST